MNISDSVFNVLHDQKQCTYGMPVSSQKHIEFLLAEAPVNTLSSLTEGMTNLLSSWLGLRSKWEVKRHLWGSNVRGFLKEKRKQSLCRDDAVFPVRRPVHREERMRRWNGRRAYTLSAKRRYGSTFVDVQADRVGFGALAAVLQARGSSV